MVGRGGRTIGLVLALGFAWAVLAQDAPAPAGSAAAKQAMPAADQAAAPAATEVAEIPLAGAAAAGVHEASAPNAWGGERQGNEATLSDRVVGYRIDAELDAAKHAVTGSEQMTWRNRSDRPVRSVYLHLYLNAFKNEGSTFFTERHVLTAHGHSRGAATLKKGQWGYIDLKRVQQGGAALNTTLPRA